MNLNDKLYNVDNTQTMTTERFLQEQLTPAFRRLEGKVDKAQEDLQPLEEKLNRCISGVEKQNKKLDEILKLLKGE